MTFPEQYAASLCVWREARGESQQAQRAVFHVLNNRTKDEKKRWPDSIIKVVLQPFQFSCFNASDPNAAKHPGLQDPSWFSCCAAVEFPGEDPTSGANHYESISDPGKRPAWCNTQKITAQIGAFRFYKL